MEQAIIDILQPPAVVDVDVIIIILISIIRYSPCRLF